jgi:hypothetical protein
LFRWCEGRPSDEPPFFVVIDGGFPARAIGRNKTGGIGLNNRTLALRS